MPYTKAISPVSNSYLTKGKEYEIVWISAFNRKKRGWMFKIINNNGDESYCHEIDCAHLEGLSWELK